MIATNLPPRPPPHANLIRPAGARRIVRWLLPATLLTVAPKCLLCLALYTGFGVALGLGGPELCGAPVPSSHSWVTACAWFGAAGFTAIAVYVSSLTVRSVSVRLRRLRWRGLISLL